MSEYISDRRSKELDQRLVSELFECEMQEVDERLITPEDAMSMLRSFVRREVAQRRSHVHIDNKHALCNNTTYKHQLDNPNMHSRGLHTKVTSLCSKMQGILYSRIQITFLYIHDALWLFRVVHVQQQTPMSVGLFACVNFQGCLQQSVNGH